MDSSRSWLSLIVAVALANLMGLYNIHLLDASRAGTSGLLPPSWIPFCENSRCSSLKCQIGLRNRVCICVFSLTIRSRLIVFLCVSLTIIFLAYETLKDRCSLCLQSGRDRSSRSEPKTNSECAVRVHRLKMSAKSHSRWYNTS